MNSLWQNHLHVRGAVVEAERVAHFGNLKAELDAARSATVIADLSHFGLINFSGKDAEAFLQGQLSCDVRQVSTGSAGYGSYCTPKGRMLANFLLWRSEGGYSMQLPQSLREHIQKRLAMFVLRAKVKLADCSDSPIRLGIAGAGAETLITKQLGEVPAASLGVIHGEFGAIIRLSEDRIEVVAGPEQATALWDELRKDALPVGALCWDWLDIREGIPYIVPETQDQFVPQMANLEVIGGVSFNKGCYPGQEIVARAQYLGKLKRRMFLANIQSATPPAPADELYSTDTEGQASGMIVNAAPSPDGGYDALAVIQVSSAEAGDVHWKNLEGPALKLMPLPYSV